MAVERPENPLTDRQDRIVEANANLPDECPNPECDLTPEVADLTRSASGEGGRGGQLYIVHEEDGVGLASRTPRGENDGCRISAANDPTLGGE